MSRDQLGYHDRRVDIRWATTVALTGGGGVVTEDDLVSVLGPFAPTQNSTSAASGTTDDPASLIGPLSGICSVAGRIRVHDY